MTWEEWVDSEYGVSYAYIQDNEVWFSQIPVPEGSMSHATTGKLIDVEATDVIVAENAYNYELS